MATFTNESHDGASQLDSTFDQLRDQALKQGRPWRLDVTNDGSVITVVMAIGPKEEAPAAPVAETKSETKKKPGA